MKLNDMTRKPTLKQLNKVTESRFGLKIDYNSITLPKANAMRNKIYETVSAIRKTSAVHTAEKNPQYLEMLIVYEGLSRWIDAYKAQRGNRKLYEGEVGQAQAILAAKDMVDTVQDLIEKVGKMQNEQLPALIDSIRDQIGMAQADTFKNGVSQSLTTMATTLGQAREQLDTAARSLAGEDAGMGGDAMGMPGADPMAGGMGADPMAGAAGGDFEMPPEEGDGFGAVDAASGGPEELGREHR
jgi:hypothetical protein